MQEVFSLERVLDLETQVLIVGAGLSGLVAARELQANGIQVTVLDKGRSVGGRLATRRIGEGMADHGAQFFTVRTETFQKQVDDWLDEKLVSIWGHGWSDGSLKRTMADGHPRYIANNGMNSLAQSLASGLTDVHVDVQVASIVRSAGFWQLTAANGAVFRSQALLMTPPVPQSLALLTGVELHADDRADLERIQYGPCLCGMFLVDGDINLPEPGALQDFTQTVYWIADNQQKGISPAAKVITTHAEVRFSRAHYDDADDVLLAKLREPVETRLKSGAKIVEEQLKKWRYSIPLVTHPHDCLVARGLPLAFAGDAFGGRGRVEGAYLSGWSAAAGLQHLVS